MAIDRARGLPFLRASCAFWNDKSVVKTMKAFKEVFGEHSFRVKKLLNNLLCSEIIDLYRIYSVEIHHVGLIDPDEKILLDFAVWANSTPIDNLKNKRLTKA